MANPSIEELHDPNKFEQIAELGHPQIKDFVLEQLAKGGALVTTYMGYQIIMLLLGIWFIIRAILLAFNHSASPFIMTALALVFSFTLLILIHELLHGLALKITGAPKVHYGAYFQKFIFYAEADRHVLNKKQFAFVALTPLIVVQVLTLVGILIFWYSPVFYFSITVMAAHSFFCAGDIGLLTIFLRDSKVYTYDVREEKKSYYFKKR